LNPELRSLPFGSFIGKSFKHDKDHLTCPECDSKFYSLTIKHSEKEIFNALHLLHPHVAHILSGGRVPRFRLIGKKTKRKSLNDPVGGTGSKHIRELLDGQRESFSEKTRGLFDGHGKSFRNLGGRMAFHKQDNESTFVNAGAGWLNDGENGQFYSLTFEREVIDKYWDHLVVNGCLLIKNQFKGDDGRKPDVILRLRVPSDDVKGQTDDESSALN